MKSKLLSSSSVTRWLLVVVGCTVLETVQPMIAAPEPTAPRTGDTLLFPTGNAPAAPAVTPSANAGSVGGTWVFIGLTALAAGGFWWWRLRGRSPLGRRGSISIEDTRPLGNRQFLVVASCDGRRFLLGVAPGGIQMLSPLDSKDDADDEHND